MCPPVPNRSLLSHHQGDLLLASRIRRRELVRASTNSCFTSPQPRRVFHWGVAARHSCGFPSSLWRRVRRREVVTSTLCLPSCLHTRGWRDTRRRWWAFSGASAGSGGMSGTWPRPLGRIRATPCAAAASMTQQMSPLASLAPTHNPATAARARPTPTAPGAETPARMAVPFAHQAALPAMQ